MGRRLAASLGKGWQVRVHENMGWHYTAVLGEMDRETVSIKVSESFYGPRFDPSYSALIGRSSSGEHGLVGKGGTAQAAVDDALEKAKALFEKLRGFMDQVETLTGRSL